MKFLITLNDDLLTAVLARVEKENLSVNDQVINALSKSVGLEKPLNASDFMPEIVENAQKYVKAVLSGDESAMPVPVSFFMTTDMPSAQLSATGSGRVVPSRLAQNIGKQLSALVREQKIPGLDLLRNEDGTLNKNFWNDHTANAFIVVRLREVD